MSVRQRLEAFLLPERPVPLKVVFDNIRNYFICGAVLGMALWFKGGKATAPTALFAGTPKDGWLFLIYASLTVFAVLFFLNICQSFLIASRLLLPVADLPEVALAEVTTRRGRWYVAAFLEVIVFFLTWLILALALTLALLAIYFSWFAAVGGQQ